MATSTAPAFKKALVAAVQAAIPDLVVSYGWPEDNDADEVVWVGDTRIDQEWAAIARTLKPRAEDYTFDVVIEVANPTWTAEEAADRAWALLASIEDVLRNAANPQGSVTLGVAGVWQSEFRTAQEELGVVRDPSGLIIGRACRITAGVHVQARIKL